MYATLIACISNLDMDASKKIIWTDFAIENLKDIFDYYSVKANKKIAHKIRKSISLVSQTTLLVPIASHF